MNCLVSHKKLVALCLPSKKMIQEKINLVVTTLTLVSHAVLVFGLVMFFTNKQFKDWLLSFVNKYILSLLFLISLSAFIGSLVYSEVAGFPPCELCWIQRIFMYPQVILSFVAWIKKDKGIVSYLLPLTSIGGFVAFYHSITHFGLGDGLLECTSALGDCGKLYVFEYGYITIPLMSFTIFAYLFVLTLVYFRSVKERI